MKRLPIILALSTIASAGAAAQGPSVEQRLARELDAETYAAVNQVVGAARAKSLPVEPLLDKALEGSVKGASSLLIRNAVVALADRMVIAREMLSPPSPSAADISAGAGALARGIPRETLRTIRIASAGRPVAVPLGVLTELVVRGVPVRRASDQVVALVRSGATPQQLASLSDEVRHDIQAGINAGDALDVRTRGLLPLLPGAGGQALNALKPASPQKP